MSPPNAMVRADGRISRICADFRISLVNNLLRFGEAGRWFNGSTRDEAGLSRESPEALARESRI
jgi:hypothetical protein